VVLLEEHLEDKEDEAVAEVLEGPVDQEDPGDHG
jgi:hypothetical protein